MTSLDNLVSRFSAPAPIDGVVAQAKVVLVRNVDVVPPTIYSLDLTCSTRNGMSESIVPFVVEGKTMKELVHRISDGPGENLKCSTR